MNSNFTGARGTLEPRQLLGSWQRAINWEMQSRKAASDNEVHKSLTSNVKMCSTGCKLNDLPGLTLSLHNMPEKLLKGVIGQKKKNDEPYDGSQCSWERLGFFWLNFSVLFLSV